MQAAKPDVEIEIGGGAITFSGELNEYGSVALTGYIGKQFPQCAAFLIEGELPEQELHPDLQFRIIFSTESIEDSTSGVMISFLLFKGYVANFSKVFEVEEGYKIVGYSFIVNGSSDVAFCDYTVTIDGLRMTAVVEEV